MKTRVALVTAGALVIAYAVAGTLTDPGADPVGIAVFLLAVLAAHDAAWMLIVLAAGALITRLVPPRHRTAVRTAAISAATVSLVAFPLVIGFGRTPDNPSILPLPYGRNLALVLLAVAAATVVAAVWRRTRRKDSESTRRSPAEPADR